MAPFLVSPALAVLGIASPTGLALALARLAVLLVLACAVPAALQVRRFITAAGLGVAQLLGLSLAVGQLGDKFRDECRASRG